MGLRGSREQRREIISEESLHALRELIEFLKSNVRLEGLFRRRGRARGRRRILYLLRRGDRLALRPLLQGAAAALESAAALQLFLKRLPRPLIPTRVQRLLLAENAGVPEGVVAGDALGLLAQEAHGRHLALLAHLLELLHAATSAAGASSELRGCALPLLLLPTFLDLKAGHFVRWRRVAATFAELISRAPDWLRGRTHLLAPLPRITPHDSDAQLEESPCESLQSLHMRCLESRAEEPLLMRALQVAGVAMQAAQPESSPSTSEASGVVSEVASEVATVGSGVSGAGRAAEPLEGDAGLVAAGTVAGRQRGQGGEARGAGPPGDDERQAPRLLQRQRRHLAHGVPRATPHATPLRRAARPTRPPRGTYTGTL